MSAPVDLVLERLDGVRRTGDRRWIARCPAHEDRGPSLSIGESAVSGSALVHCFAGCSAEEGLAALNLDMADLFPARPSHRGPRQRPPWPAVHVLRCVAHEALLVAVSASRLANGHALDDAERARLLVAAGRIQTALEESGYAR